MEPRKASPVAEVEIHPVLPRGWSRDGFGPLPVVIAQIPDPATLAPGSRVHVHAFAKPPASFFARALLGAAGLVRRPRFAHLAIRCSALLARGYAQIGAGSDKRGRGDVAFGVVDPPTP